MDDLLVPLSFFSRTGMQISRKKKEIYKRCEVFSRMYHQDKFKFCWQAMPIVGGLERRPEIASGLSGP